MYLAYPHTSHHARLEDLFERELPVRAVAHLTFPFSVGREQAGLYVNNWVRSLQSQHRTTLGYILAYEQTRYIPLHLHAALIATRSLDQRIIRDTWLAEVGTPYTTSIQTSLYCPGEGGLAYVLKADDENCCDVRYSNNLALFTNDPSKLPVAQMRWRERRRLAHIQLQGTELSATGADCVTQIRS